MLPASTQNETPFTSVEVDDHASSASTAIHRDASDITGLNQASQTSDTQARAKAWQPRQHASHIFRSANGTWYLRLAVPADVRARHPELPKELKRSTETANRRLAETRAREMCIEFSIRYTTGTAPMQTPDTLTNNSFSIVFNNGALQSNVAHGASAETMLLMGRCLQLVTLQICGRSARSGSEQAGAGEPIFIPTPLASSQSTAPSSISQIQSAVDVASNDTPWLSDAIEDWCENGSGRFSQVTWDTVYKPSFRVFSELVGIQRRDRIGSDGSKKIGILDIRLQDLRRNHISQLRDLLKELPPNQGKRTNDQEAMQRIQNGRKDKVQPPSRASVSKKLNHLSAFFEYSKRKGWIEQQIFDEYMLAKEGAEKDAAEESAKKNPGYVALSQTELKTLYEQPSFLEGALKGPWRYWVPLICLHQGCRVSEAAQLFTDDIIRMDGVPCIAFIADESDEEECPEDEKPAPEKKNKKNKTYKTVEEFRRLKTKSSRRIVPIHPKLIELGFLDFVNSFSQISSLPQHLFDDLKWEEKAMFGRYPSQHVIQLLKDSGIWKKYKKVGHSLRSNFKQALEKTMLMDNLQQRLLGHSPQTMKDSKYNETDIGPAFPAAEVLPYMAKVDFGLCIPKWSEVHEQIVSDARLKDFERQKRRNGNSFHGSGSVPRA